MSAHGANTTKLEITKLPNRAGSLDRHVRHRSNKMTLTFTIVCIVVAWTLQYFGKISFDTAYVITVLTYIHQTLFAIHKTLCGIRYKL